MPIIMAVLVPNITHVRHCQSGSVHPSGYSQEFFGGARISLHFVENGGSARCSHNISTYSNVRQINPVHAPAHSFSFHFNIFLACTPMYTWSLSLRFSHHNRVRIAPLLHTCYVQSHFSFPDCTNRTVCVQQYQLCRHLQFLLAFSLSHLGPTTFPTSFQHIMETSHPKNSQKISLIL